MAKQVITAVAEDIKLVENQAPKEWRRVYPEYIAVESVDEAVGILGQYGSDAKILAGGIDPVGFLKRETLSSIPRALVSVARISGLNVIASTGQGVKIGALTKINDLERSALINERYTMLAVAAHAIGSPQIRNMGTIAGNVCQDVRCLYYRRPKGTGTDFHCLRKTPEGECFALCGENREHGIFNHGSCVAPCVSDLAVALTAYDARLRTVDSTGGRTMSVPDLFTPLGKTLRPDEVVTAIEIPDPGKHAIAAFQKFRMRKAIDFAIVSVAAVIRLEDGMVSGARIAVGGVAYMPYQDAEAEQYLTGKPLTEKTAAEAAEIFVSKAQPLEKNAHKVQITRALVKRAILGESNT